MMRSSKTFGILALPLCASVACATDPAGEPAESSELDHCVVTMDGNGQCYATFTEAIAAATGGKIADAAADSAEAFADGTLTDRINAIWAERQTKGPHVDPPTPGSGNIVIGIVNHDKDFKGKDWVFLAGQGCTRTDATPDWAVQNLNTSPYTVSQMNDNISSVRSFSDCKTTLYGDWKLNVENPGAGQAVYTTASYVGDVMNDAASSISWHR